MEKPICSQLLRFFSFLYGFALGISCIAATGTSSEISSVVFELAQRYGPPSLMFQSKRDPVDEEFGQLFKNHSDVKVSVANLLAIYGLLPLPNQEIAELHNYLRGVLQSWFLKEFGEYFDDIDVVVLNANIGFAYVFALPYQQSRRNGYHEEHFWVPSRRPTIVIDKKFLQTFEFEDEIVFVFEHEGFHVVRAAKLINEPNNTIKNFRDAQAEEIQMDVKALQGTLKAGYNPQAAGLFFEKVIQLERDQQKMRLRAAFLRNMKRDIEQLPFLPALLTHPPTDLRISFVNAQTEQLADRHEFPHFRSITEIVKKAQQAEDEPPLWPPRILAWRASISSPSVAYEEVGDFVRTFSRIEKVKDKTDTESKFVIFPEKALSELKDQFQRGQAFTPSPAIFLDLMRLTFNQIRSQKNDWYDPYNKTTKKLFLQARKGLWAAWRKVPFIYKKMSSFQNLFSDEEKNLLAMSDAEGLNIPTLLTLYEQKMQEMIGTLENFGQVEEREPRTRSLVLNNEEIVTHWNLFSDHAMAVALLHAAGRALVPFWNQLQDIDISKSFKYNTEAYLSIAKFTQELSKVFVETAEQSKIEQLRMELNALALPPLVLDHFFAPLFEGNYKIQFIQLTREQNPKFIDFLNSMKFLGHLIKTGFHRSEELKMFGHSEPPAKRNQWVYEQLGAYDLNLAEIRDVLKCDAFWPLWTKANYFFPESKDFYGENRYRIDPVQGRKIQKLLYLKLKAQNELPKNLPDEVELWNEFANRAVTEFTDEWALSLFKRILAIQDENAQLPLLKKMYEAKDIWDLVLRARVALVYYKKSPSLVKLAAQSTERMTAIAEFIDDLDEHFPEASAEKKEVRDIIAHFLKTNRSETLLMYAQSSAGDTPSFGASLHNTNEYRLSAAEGLGVRFVSQLFNEVKLAPRRDRFEFLDFMLGKNDKIPRVISEEPKKFLSFALRNPINGRKVRDPWGQSFEVKGEFDTFPALLLMHELVGAYRTRRIFQAMTPQMRAVLLDGWIADLFKTSAGKRWIANTLLDGRAQTWRSLGMDLLEGAIQGLKDFGQIHQKSLLLSYIVASRVRSSRSDYEQIFPITSETPQERGQDETDEGYFMRVVFSSSSAFKRLGQRLHSSHLLRPEHNASLAKIKEDAAIIPRDALYDWVDDATICQGPCSDIELLEPLGNASVKAVVRGLYKGQEKVISLILPNALRRGEVSFQIAESAVRYALSKGHKILAPLPALISSARASFAEGIDLENEVRSTRKVAQVFQPGKKYGDGFEFETVVFDELDPTVFNPKRIAMANPAQTARFSDVSEQRRTAVAEAIRFKLAEIHDLDRKSSVPMIQTELDRHEGNFLPFIDQPRILVIDGAEYAEIAVATQQAFFDIVAAVAAAKERLISIEQAVQSILKTLTDNHLSKYDKTVNALMILRAALRPTLFSSRNPFEDVSALFSRLETNGFIIDHELKQYMMALATEQTWEQFPLGPSMAATLEEVIRARVIEIVNSQSSTQKCILILRRFASGRLLPSSK